MLELIKGGQKAKNECERVFVEGKITNTRFMGSLYLYAKWKIIDSPESDFLHQFFYIDTEEYGIENYFSIWNNNLEEVARLESEMSGSLGGKFISITQNELSIFLKHFYPKNLESNNPLPGVVSEYIYLLERPMNLSFETKERVLKKSCAKIRSHMELIHYFIMRCGGKDFETANYLSMGDVDVSLFSDLKISILCRNKTIEIESSKEGINYYRCESLFDNQGQYVIMVFMVEVRDNLISALEIVDKMNISSWEAALLISAPEFITVYDVDNAISESDIYLDLPFNTTFSEQKNGKLFLLYNSTNDHILKDTFLLNEDIYGLIFVSQFGELIICSNSPERGLAIESAISKSEISKNVELIERYYFEEPVIFDFIQSDYNFFDEFVEDIRE